MPQCSLHDVLPPQHCCPALTPARTGSADANEHISPSYGRRKHQPHCRDEEMRHTAVKVRRFHLLLVPSLRHLSMVSQSSVSPFAGRKGKCVPGVLLVPRARELGLRLLPPSVRALPHENDHPLQENSCKMPQHH